MNLSKLLYAILTVVLVSCFGAIGWAQVSAAGVNYDDAALLKWYAANHITHFDPSTHFFGFSAPHGVAFDGANIWVTFSDRGNNVGVVKFRAADGVKLVTVNFGTASYGAAGLAFDGANIWVADPPWVTKLRAADGAFIARFRLGGYPEAIAFDGANIWVTDAFGNTVTKLRASDGANQGTFTVGQHPYGVAFDGSNIWVANHDDGTVTKLRAADGAPLGTYSVGTYPGCANPVCSYPVGVAFDGANIWVAGNVVNKLRAADGASLGTFTAVGGDWLAFDGNNIWVTNVSSVSKLRAADGALLGTFPVGAGADGVAFDGANIWVAAYSSGWVSKL